MILLVKKETFRKERRKIKTIEDAERVLDSLDDVKRKKEFVLEDSRERRACNRWRLNNE